MERNFNNEFERFLKENADQYRMYPSAKVWSGIYNTLHTRRKWFGLGIILLLLTGSLVTVLVTRSPKETGLSVNRPVTTEKRLAPHSQIAPAGKHIVENKFPINSSLATTENRQVISNNIFYGTPGNDLTTDENTLHFNEPATNSEPLAIDITDELTDQDFINNARSQKISTYPRKFTASNPFDWTIESVLNSFRPPKHKRFAFQLNFTPTISYRKLSANKAFLRSANQQANAPFSFAALYDVNSAVTHKPDIGLELGFTEKYSLASNFRVKAGLQFNVNRYDIKAFNYQNEFTTIALKTNAGVDSVLTTSSHRNFSGYKSDWLQNFYFEISAPVGIEIDIAGDDRVQFGVAGTIQPTYILGDRAYLLSTDYKNYAEVPWLIRRWNISTGLETFVSYSTGKMKWQVGPQIRYQLLSSFVEKYPVKENLFDFGLKVGVSLNK
ncbi:MAG TPA: hypothetical protein VE933_10075 [Chitinophagaceae bacterium]|nr:hypothetical protein [Chitinophagaceae bacterium]